MKRQGNNYVEPSQNSDEWTENATYLPMERF